MVLQLSHLCHNTSSLGVALRSYQYQYSSYQYNTGILQNWANAWPAVLGLTGMLILAHLGCY
jgi:hypothetical protein